MKQIEDKKKPLLPGIVSQKIILENDDRVDSKDKPILWTIFCFVGFNFFYIGYAFAKDDVPNYRVIPVIFGAIYLLWVFIKERT